MSDLIYVASSNAGKLTEIMLGVELWQRHRKEMPGARLACTIELLPGFALLPRCAEDADTFAGNARKKALYYSRLTKSPRAWVLADDSGLVVDALDGAPGIYSARYAGPNATDADNNHMLIDALRDVPPPRRTARFVCALALANEDAVVAEFSGVAEGAILDTPRGTHGFGYDPLFLDPLSGKTYAELTAEEKLERSHRGQALFALLDWLAVR